MKKAIGLIETYGYIGAIEALDACLKAANVALMNCEFVRGGLVSIVINGDVGDVKTSVDAGSSAASKVGQLVSTHVIPRPNEDVKKLIDKVKEKEKEVNEDMAKKSIDECIRLERDDLIKMKVSDLRTLARSIDGISIERKMIKYSKKKELIDAILMARRKEGKMEND